MWDARARREYKQQIKMMANLCFLRANTKDETKESMRIAHERSSCGSGGGGGSGVFGFNSKENKIIKMNAIKLNAASE